MAIGAGRLCAARRAGTYHHISSRPRYRDRTVWRQSPRRARTADRCDAPGHALHVASLRGRQEAMNNSRKRAGRPRQCPDHVLHAVLMMRRHGATFRSICARMNGDGVPTPGGSPTWYPSHVSRLLHTRSAKEFAQEHEKVQALALNGGRGLPARMEGSARRYLRLSCSSRGVAPSIRSPDVHGWQLSRGPIRSHICTAFS